MEQNPRIARVFCATALLRTHAAKTSAPIPGDAPYFPAAALPKSANHSHAAAKSSQSDAAPKLPSSFTLLKLLCLALRNFSKKWTVPIRDWKAALNRFTIQFKERLPQAVTQIPS
jgi:hypothetical protein